MLLTIRIERFARVNKIVRNVVYIYIAVRTYDKFQTVSLDIWYMEASVENESPVGKHLTVTSGFNYGDNARRVVVSVFFIRF